MRIYDLSPALPDVPVFPGDPETVITRVLNLKDGATCNLSSISASLHAGTHADAPLHFIEGGRSIAELPLERFVGPARVVTVNVPGNITGKDITGLDVRPGERILLKTRNSLQNYYSRSRFEPGFCALEPDAATYLSGQGAALVGIDYASIGTGETNSETHRIILGSHTAVLEGIDLSAVPDGDYFLCAAPIKVTGGDGAPVRALLMDFRLRE